MTIAGLRSMIIAGLRSSAHLQRTPTCRAVAVTTMHLEHALGCPRVTLLTVAVTTMLLATRAQVPEGKTVLVKDSSTVLVIRKMPAHDDTPQLLHKKQLGGSAAGKLQVRAAWFI